MKYILFFIFIIGYFIYAWIPSAYYYCISQSLTPCLMCIRSMFLWCYFYCWLTLFDKTLSSLNLQCKKKLTGIVEQAPWFSRYFVELGAAILWVAFSYAEEDTTPRQVLLQINWIMPNTNLNWVTCQVFSLVSKVIQLV